jgi:hypothetical protein
MQCLQFKVFVKIGNNQKKYAVLKMNLANLQLLENVFSLSLYKLWWQKYDNVEYCIISKNLQHTQEVKIPIKICPVDHVVIPMTFSQRQLSAAHNIP